MKSFKTKITVGSVLTGILLVFGPYQNCAIHQSEGRKNFEKILRSRTQPELPHCMPYISQNEAVEIFNSGFDTTTKSTVVGDFQVCLIQGTEVFHGLELATCTLKSDYRMQSSPETIGRNMGMTIYQNKVFYFVPTPPGQSVISGEIGTVTPPDGQEKNYYGVAVERSATEIDFHFINTELSLECRFTLDKSAYDDQGNGLGEAAATRGSLLMHKIVENCTNNICLID